MNFRTRVALLIGAAVLVATAIAAVGVGVSSRNLGRSRLDQQLRADANSLISAFEGRQRQLGAFVVRSSAECEDGSLSEVIEEEGRGAAVEDSRERRRRPPEAGIGISVDRSVVIQVVRPTGSILSLCRELPVSEHQLEIASRGHGSEFSTVTVDGHRLRMITVGASRGGAVQVARELEVIEDTLSGLSLRLAVFGSVGACLAAALGWYWARRVTDPLRELNATADSVARTRNLGERIDVNSDDEIGDLARSFNHMLESLDSSRAQQQRLVQDASHEFRTPLTSIRTNLELMQRHRGLDEATRNKVIDDIAAELVELSELAAELVDSATEVSSGADSFVELSFDALATQAVERAKRRHTRTYHVAHLDRVTVLGDGTLLERAMANLLANAAKFSDPSTSIDVEARLASSEEVRLTVGSHGWGIEREQMRPKPMAWFAVHDRGPGIPQGDLDLIFDRFYRSTATRTAPGSGLGLSIVRQIVESHGGTAFARNRTGGGASVGFWLPVAE